MTPTERIAQHYPVLSLTIFYGPKYQTNHLWEIEGRTKCGKEIKAMGEDLYNALSLFADRLDATLGVLQ